MWWPDPEKLAKRCLAIYNGAKGIKGKDGKIKYEKKKAKIRNERLDCFVYAYAACRAMHPSLRKVSRRMKSAQDAARQVGREHGLEGEAET